VTGNATDELMRFIGANRLRLWCLRAWADCGRRLAHIDPGGL